MNEDSVKKKRRNWLQKPMTMSKISKAWMEERDWKRCTVRPVLRSISGKKKNQGCVTFALSWPFQRDCGTAAGRLCHAFSDFSCDSVKLVQDM